MEEKILKIILYTNNPARTEALMLNQELKARGHISNICTTWSVDLPNTQEGLPEADLVYVITPVLFNGTAFEMANRLISLESWNDKAVLLNPLNSLLHSTKAHFTNYCNKFSIPHPRTLITENPSKALEFTLSIFRQGKQVVLKPVSRGEGVGVHLLQPMDSDTLLRYLLWYSSEYGDRVFYIQEFVDNLGYDLRLFVINGAVVARMKRSKTNDFLFNLSRGGVGEAFQKYIRFHRRGDRQRISDVHGVSGRSAR